MLLTTGCLWYTRYSLLSTLSQFNWILWTNLYSLDIWKCVNCKTGHFSLKPTRFRRVRAELAVPCALLTQIMWVRMAKLISCTSQGLGQVPQPLHRPFSLQWNEWYLTQMQLWGSHRIQFVKHSAIKQFLLALSEFNTCFFNQIYLLPSFLPDLPHFPTLYPL